MLATQARAGSRLLAIDGLRLLCALAVAGYHYGVSWRMDGVRPPAYFLPHASHALIYGFLGVEVFFLISGFVICMSSWGRGLRGFAVSRFTRLYPAFWICLFVTVTVALLVPLTTGVPYSSAVSVRDVLLNLTMAPQAWHAMPIDTVYWTLWAELRFYLLFAVVVMFGLTYRRVVVFCVAWLVLAMVAPAWAHDAVQPDFATYFVGGIGIYLIHRFGSRGLPWAIVGLSWLVAMARVADRIATLEPGFAVPVWPARLIITAGYLALLAVALGRTRWITWSWLPVAGALTYPFYLLHQRLGYTLIRAGYRYTWLPAWVLLIAAVALLLTLAWLVHRYGERPLSAALRTRLMPRRAARLPQPAPDQVPDPDQVPELDQVPEPDHHRPADLVRSAGTG